jgi:DNA-binding HxlR family transcriptional regulator
MIINDKEILVEMNGEIFHCAMDVAMNFIGGKWKTVVLWYLKNDKKRFAELDKLIPQMTERMLSITLKQLEEDGLVLREVYTTKPPLKVEYSLTDLGKSCIPMLDEIANWGIMMSKTKGKVIEQSTKKAL